jgi:hypothetical protein
MREAFFMIAVLPTVKEWACGTHVRCQEQWASAPVLVGTAILQLP